MPLIGNAATSPLDALADQLKKFDDPTDTFTKGLTSLYASLDRVNTPLATFTHGIDALGEKLRASGRGHTDAASNAGKNAAHLTRNMHAVSAAMGNPIAGLARLGPAIAGVAGPIGMVAAAALAAPAAIIGMGVAIEQFVAKANPAAAFQFNQALDDLNGTIGQIMTPVLQGITAFVRDFADGLQGLKPAFEPIMTGIGQVIAALGPLAQAYMQIQGPALQMVGDIITGLVVPAVKSLADTLVDFYKTAMHVIEELTSGMISFGEYEAKSSVGAAIRPAAYSKIEDIGNRTTLSALNKTDTSRDIPKKIDKTNDYLQKILEKIGVDKNSTVGRAAKGVDVVAPGLKVVTWLGKQIRDL